MYMHMDNYIYMYMYRPRKVAGVRQLQSQLVTRGAGLPVLFKGADGMEMLLALAHLVQPRVFFLRGHCLECLRLSAVEEEGCALELRGFLRDQYVLDRGAWRALSVHLYIEI